MERALRLAIRAGTRIGAHPSYPDRVRFGRVHLDIDRDRLAASLVAQCGVLRMVAERFNRSVGFVKPHGALYHDAARDEGLAACVLAAAIEGLGRADLVVIGPPRGALDVQARRLGLRYAREGFADRGYLGDSRTGAAAAQDALKSAYLEGRLIPRGQSGALLTEPAACAEQALRLVASGVVDTICVHGDGPGAVDVARGVRAALERVGALAPLRPVTSSGR
jgi:UPF0271 protein